MNVSEAHIGYFKILLRKMLYDNTVLDKMIKYQNMNCPVTTAFKFGKCMKTRKKP